MDLDLASVAQIVGGELIGENVRVTGIGIPVRAQEGDVVVVKDRRLLKRAEASKASALIIGEDVPGTSKPAVKVARPVLAMIRLLNHLGRPKEWAGARSGISPDARLGEGVKMGNGVWVGAYAVIGDNVRIGDRVRICPNTVIGDEVVIGSDTTICPNVTVYPGTTIGERVLIHSGTVIGSDGFNFEEDDETGVVHKVPHLGSVVIDDDVEIGSNCCIDRGVYGTTRVGRHSKLDNLVQIAHDVHVGARCGFAGQAGVAGDTILGDGVLLMGRAGVADSIVVAPRTVVLAHSVVTGDTAEGEVYSGYPALPHKQQREIWRALLRLPSLVSRFAEDTDRKEAGSERTGT